MGRGRQIVGSVGLTTTDRGPRTDSTGNLTSAERTDTVGDLAPAETEIPDGNLTYITTEVTMYNTGVAARPWKDGMTDITTSDGVISRQTRPDHTTLPDATTLTN